MAGIYLHIPFCKQACHYCDFHFSTNTRIRTDLVLAMCEEISLQCDYLEGDEVRTVYFGGGTPSMLQADEIGLLLDRLSAVFRISSEAEITLEANPDDLTLEGLRALRSLGINRLSIGIQSFNDAILSWLNRAHTSEAATHCVEDARTAGFDNISIDLIYAIPGLTFEEWQKTIRQAMELQTPHISAYTLTIEEKTALGKWLKQGKFRAMDESGAAEQMETLVSLLASGGYHQYEISNFARPGFESQHNGNYWSGGKYLGIGPSAHSFNQRSRQHNVSNNHLYVRSLREHRIPAEKETLKKEEQINEYILTSLRTDVGCDLNYLKDDFAYDLMTVHEGYLNQLLNARLARVAENHLQLTQAGRLLADKISSDLFLIE